MSEWISVKDRLPEKMDFYWCALDTGGCDYLGYFPKDKSWCDENGRIDEKVTHWMPLPSPPTNEDELCPECENKAKVTASHSGTQSNNVDVDITCYECEKCGNYWHD